MDAYFGQDSNDLVIRARIKQELKPKAQGFLRVGVSNLSTEASTSLFSALAPLLDVNSASDVAKLLDARITPRVFLNLNFGNLVLEFFNPADKEPTDAQLALWANK